MNTQTIAEQLKKALNCKDDKELRMRVEVLLDILESMPEMRAPIRTQYEQPILPRYDEEIQPKIQPKITGKKGGQVRGAGSITSLDTEQINYSRPAGT